MICMETRKKLQAVQFVPVMWKQIGDVACSLCFLVTHSVSIVCGGTDKRCGWLALFPWLQDTVYYVCVREPIRDVECSQFPWLQDTVCMVCVGC